MNEERRWPLMDAYAVAVAVKSKLRPFCHRICIAGSIRRRKPDVGDIELLFIPKLDNLNCDLFGEPTKVDLVESSVLCMIQNRVLEKRENVKGVETYGPKIKLMRHVQSGIPIDLFTTTPENWWVSLVVRTGPKELNLRLTTGAQRRGLSLLAFGCGVRNLQTGEVTPAHSEREVFELCGVPYLEPKDR